MIETLSLATKTKVLLALSSLLLIAGGVFGYSIPQDQADTQNIDAPAIASPSMNSYSAEAAENLDPYSKDVLQGAKEVNNSVQEVVFQYGKQEHWQYKQTYEGAIQLIRNENLESQQAYQKLDPDKKEINKAYRAYLHEAAFVAYSNYEDSPTNTTAMIEANNTLNNLIFA